MHPACEATPIPVPAATGGSFRYQILVPAEAIDRLGHVNNIEFVRWLQDAALRHSERVGLSWEECVRVGGAFVVRRQQVEYLRQVRTGEQLTVHTWIASSTHMSAVRRTEVRSDTGDLVVDATTTWVFVSLETWRPKRIPTDVRRMFGMDLPMHDA